MRRDVSRDDFSGFSEPNPNTDFIGGRGFWLWYFITLLIFRLFLGHTQNIFSQTFSCKSCFHVERNSSTFLKMILSSSQFLISTLFEWTFLLMVLPCFLFCVMFGAGVLLDSVPWTSSAYVWSVLHIGHGFITFFIMHYVTGLPFWMPDSQGKYDGQTFWEQIDNGRQFTSNRKVLTLIPVALFLLSTMETGWSSPLMFFNFFVLCVVALLPKSGAMDGYFAVKSST